MVRATYSTQKNLEPNNDVNDFFDQSFEMNQYYQSLFENNADFVYSTNLDGYFTSVNPAFVNTFGIREEDVVGKHALSFINVEDIPRVRKHFLNALKGKEQYFNLEMPIKSGEKQLFQIKNVPITVNGERVGTYGIGRNITAQKRIEERIVQLAYYDHDTGLPNRMKFTEYLEDVMHRARRLNQIFAVMFIDMDRFKIINDSLGHYTGDCILKELASRIQAELPPRSIFGRFGGDKFTLILAENASIESAKELAVTLLRIISKPIFHENLEYVITASIGISFFPSDGLNEELILKNADIAMNRSKNLGGNQITFYSNEMNEQAIHRLELESYLRKALEKNEFYLCYQPIIDLETGKLISAEALIRWKHPKRGNVSPGEFIPLAEETGLIYEIGSWVLRSACRQTKEWQNMGFSNLGISVNVSAHQFQQPTFLSEVKRALNETGLQPKYLTLELTESVMVRNITHSISVMNALQELGVNVSIDDFGTGYSSLSYLRNLPINILKIDREFINNLHVDNSDIAIVKAVITMGKGLAVKIVAEGVEKKEQLDLLRELECNYAQGYYFHEPLDVHQVEQELKGIMPVSIY